MDDLLRDFVAETLENIEVVDVELVHFEQDPGNEPAREKIFRLVHTIKGTCGFLGLGRLEALAHGAEHLITRFREKTQVAPQDVSLVLAALDRIRFIVQALGASGREPPGSDRDILDAIDMRAAAASHPVADAQVQGNIVYQVLERALRPGEATLDELEKAFRDAPGPVTDHAVPEADVAAGPADASESTTGPMRTSVRVAVDRLDHLMTMVSELVLVRNQLLDVARRDESGGYKVPLQRLSNITGELQDGVMRTRMHAIGSAWANMPRIARDLSGELGKQISIKTTGDDTEIDRQLLEVIKDSLVHMVRNAADHGIEPPAERIASDKPAMGTIKLSAWQEGSHIIVEVADDGRGIDTARLRDKAVSLGLIDEAARDRMTDAEAAQLVFRTGLSTAGAVTSLSGRGVGLGAVKANIERAGGTVEVINRPGRGLALVLKLPLTLAIAAVLIVEAGGRRYALPQLTIVELVRTQPGGDIRVEQIGGAVTLRMREHLLPLVSLEATLDGKNASVPDNGFVAVCQFGTQRFGLAVDAILHSEEIVVKPISSKLRAIPYFSGATILGDGSIILILDPGGFARLAVRSGVPSEEQDVEAVRAEAGAALTSLLVYKSAGGRDMVVPLALVSRLIEIDANALEVSGEGIITQYRDRLMAVAGFDAAHLPPAGSSQPMILFEHRGLQIGVAAADIVDVIDAELNLDLTNAAPGSLGNAIIQGRTMGVLDVAALFKDRRAASMECDDGRKPSLLLLEADAFLASMLAPLLQGAGYEVIHAGTLDTAVSKLESRRFDCAVLDLDVTPEATLDLARALSRQNGSRAVLTVGTASRPSHGLTQRARAAGMVETVGKFDRRALLSALQRADASGELAA